MIPYILYAAIILTACFIFYKLLLQKETFFHLNRIVLLSCMALAFSLPLIKIPEQLSFRKTPAQINVVAPVSETTMQENIIQSINQKVSTHVVQPLENNKRINFEQVMDWLVYLYWFGVILFGFNFLMQACILLYKAYSRPVIIDGKFRIVEITGDKAPCSFANNIFINPEKYDWETYNQVLLHEKIHIEQKHTLDLLLAEIVIIFQWFNPFAWAWRKELESNLEYYTDESLLQHNTVEKESYQMSLLKVAAPHFPLSLTTNYNQSLLKKRLIMMNAKKSNLHTIWKYFFLLPLMVLFVCVFNETIVYGQKQTGKNNGEKQIHIGNEMKNEGVWFATIKNDKINFQFKSDDDENSFSGNSFLLSELKDLPVGKTGNFSLTRDAGTLEFTGKFEGTKGMGNYKFIPNKQYEEKMLKDGVDIKSNEDAIVFFMLNIKNTYVQMLKQNGYKNISKEDIIPLAALNVDEAYITSIKQVMPEINIENLVPFRSLGVDKAFIEEITKAGYKNLSPDRIITLKAQGIDGKYIADYKNATKNNMGSLDNKLNAQQDKLNEQQDLLNEQQNKLSEEQAKIDENAEKNDDGHDDIIAMKALGIDQAYINSFKEVGYIKISNADIIGFKALGITADYVKSFKNAGIKIKPENITGYKALGITADYIKSFSSAGFKNINPDDFGGLKAMNVTPEMVKEYQGLGFTDANFDNILGAKAIGATPDYIKRMKAKGHNFKTLDKYISLKAVMVD